MPRRGYIPPPTPPKEKATAQPVKPGLATDQILRDAARKAPPKTSANGIKSPQTNIPYADLPLRLSDVYESPESIINRRAIEANSPRERRTLDKFRNYYEQNRLEFNRIYERERSQGVNIETFCRRVYRGFVEAQQVNLTAKIAAVTQVDRVMREARQTPIAAIEVRIPVITLARIGELIRMPEVRFEVSNALINQLLASRFNGYVISVISDRASYNLLVEGAVSVLTPTITADVDTPANRHNVIPLRKETAISPDKTLPAPDAAKDVEPALTVESMSVSQNIPGSEQIILALVETGKALATLETTLNTVSRSERKEVRQAVATRVYEAIQADVATEAVQLLVTGCQVLIEAGQAERISKLSSSAISEIAQGADSIRTAMAEANPTSITQAVANLAMIDVTLARSVTRSAAVAAGLKIVPILVSARDVETNLETTKILLSALSAVARRAVDGRAENVVRVSFGNNAVASETVIPLAVANTPIHDTTTHRLTREEREVTAEKRAILASALHAVEVASTAGKLTTALAALMQAAAVAKEIGVALALNPLTLGFLYAGIILDRPLLRTDSQNGKYVGRAEEQWSSSNLKMIKEILESMMNPSLARGVRAVSVASLAAQFFLSGIVMRKVNADRKAAEKIITFLLKHKSTVNRLIGMIEINNIDDVVGFFDALILEANQIAGMISDPSRPFRLVKDPFSLEILEQALQIVEQPRVFLAVG